MSLAELKKAVTEQANLVRELKAAKGDKAKIKEAVDELLKRKAALAEGEAQNGPNDEEKRMAARRAKFDDLLLRKFFVVPAFEIYGGVGGLYDFGPPGCALMQNMIDCWRHHFILHEGMLEVQCTSMTPEPVLKTSGHVDKFTDFMVRDAVTHDCIRADKLLEDRMEQMMKNETDAEKKKNMQKAKNTADGMSCEELWTTLQKYNIKSDAGNAITEPFPFNLMFQSSIGPTGKAVGFLRPETAQGIFVNFKRLLEFNAGRMPFAAAQIGSAFRNEIAPRAGLLRVREFTLAEIEHFMNPQDKSHPRFGDVADLTVTLFNKADQAAALEPKRSTLRAAVDAGIISSETMGYFLGRTYLFLTKIGIKPDKLRFRQHLDTEMAHYACDCWDAEIETFYGWVECVGHADRSAYDLEVHAAETKVDLSAREVFAEKKEVQSHKLQLDYRGLGTKFGDLSKPLVKHLQGLNTLDAIAFAESLAKGTNSLSLCTGEKYDFSGLKAGWCKVTPVKKFITQNVYTPSVIEPSFGLGRIFYCVLEHSFDDEAFKDDDSRVVLRLPSSVAPFKVVVMPLSTNDQLMPLVRNLTSACISERIPVKTDESGAAIGRKYARSEELGVPFACVVDFDSVNNNTVTIRNRDTTEQIRVHLDDAPAILKQLIGGVTPWASLMQRFPLPTAGKPFSVARLGVSSSTSAHVIAQLAQLQARAQSADELIAQLTQRLAQVEKK